LGTIGRHHARVVQASARVKLVGAVDPLGDRFGAVARREDVFSSVAELLDDRPVDLAIIATPATHHAAVAIELAEAGVHVLVEKPLASTSEDGRAIQRACEAAGVCGAVGLVDRCNPALVRLHAVVRAGGVGQLLRIEAERFGSGPAGLRDVGVVRDLITHDLDLVRWIAEGPLVDLAARTAGAGVVEERAVVSGIVRGGPAFSCAANWHEPRKRRRVTVVGELGELRADTISLEVRWRPHEGAVTMDALRHHREQFVIQLDAFCDYVEGTAERPLATLDEGVDALVWAEEALACAA